MWIFKAPAGTPERGVYAGKYQIAGGLTTITRHRDRNFLLKYGFLDVTPPDLAGRWRPPDRLLVVRHGGIGDLLVVTPILRTIKHLSPMTVLDFYCANGNAAILEGNPHIANFIHHVITDGYHVMDDYDDVLDFTHTIEFNADAEFENLFDVALKRFQLEPVFKPPQPEIYLRTFDYENARDALRALGVRHKGPVVGFAPFASSTLRSYPLWESLQVIEGLLDNDCEVVLYGDLRGLDRSRVVTCGCGHQQAIVFNPGQVRVAQQCSSCRKRIWGAAPTLREGLYIMGDRHPLRTAVATLTQLDLMVTVDTGFMICSAAVDLPQLVIEGPFDGHTAGSYLRSTHVIQADYPCAPCFRHVPSCQRMDVDPASRNFPPCMRTVSPKKVVARALELLGSSARSRTMFPTFDLDLAKDNLYPLPCPICKGDKCQRVARKGRYAYFTCMSCGSCYLNRHVEDSLKIHQDPDLVLERKSRISQRKRYFDYWGGYFIETFNKLNEYPSGRLGQFLELGCGDGLMLERAEGLGWTAYGVDLVSQTRKGTLCADIEKIAVRRPGGAAAPIAIEEGQLQAVVASFDLICISRAFEHLRDPVALLAKCKPLLRTRGMVGVLTLMADALTGVESTALNTLSAGEHTVIPSTRGLAIAANLAEFLVGSQTPVADRQVAILRPAP